MKRRALACLLALCWSIPAAAAQPVPRIVIALYDSREFPVPEQSLLHRFAEMPLNHLGLVLEYHDIRKGLPDLSDRPDVRGVLVWFRDTDETYPLPDLVGYLHWADRTMQQGKRFVVFGVAGFVTHRETPPQLLAAATPFLADFGLRYEPCGWMETKAERLLYTLHLRKYNPCMITHTAGTAYVTKDSAMVEFERKLGDAPPPYFSLHFIADSHVTPYLVLRRHGDRASDSALVTVGPHGGFADEEYAVHTLWDPVTKVDDRKWYIDPFKFFAAAYATDDLPKPDTTTLDGQRIFYRHIDGDGWNNASDAAGHAQDLAARAVLEETIRPYPDLPVTVAPIAADLDAKWAGSARSQQIARDAFALPQVEAGTHTYSHPYDWNFFKDYTPQKELPFVSHYYFGNWANGDKGVGTNVSFDDYQKPGMPRDFANERFDLDKEIGGSAAFIAQFAPAGKRVAILMLSGNATPYEAVLRKVREAGLRNINGGDSRFDAAFPSYSWTAPIGREVGAERQVYASDSNDNTYTNGEQPPYDGFRQLMETVRNTESPIRIKPFNIYHHMFSGDHEASIDAVKQNLAAARASAIIPIEASRYAAIADGFYHAAFLPLGPRQWEIRDRGALQTIRFDNAEHVDFARSRGVIGEMQYQGSLYVALDESAATPVVALADRADAAAPYLIDSRWRIWNVHADAHTIRFTAQGYGKGSMHWHVPANGDYAVTLTTPGKKPQALSAKAADGMLELPLAADAIAPVDVTLRKGGR